MAPEKQQSFMPSLLDRLIDPEAAGTVWRRGYGMEEMVAAVQRDLEDLLNTRQTHGGLPTDFIEVGRSIMGYGLPDLTSLNATTPQQRQEIAHVIENVVTVFEPRLQDVRAFLVDNAKDTLERTIRFRIEARLNVDPAPPVAFDTVLELSTGHYSINSANS